MSTGSIINAIAGGVLSGALMWALLWLCVRAAALLRFKGAFVDYVLNASAEEPRSELRWVEADLQLLAAAGSAAAAAFGALLLFGGARFSGWLMWILFGLGCALFVAWVTFVVLKFIRWRAGRFAVRANAAIGASLARLAVNGHRVFHSVPLGGELLDHVVVGPKGAFAVTVVSRRTLKEATTARHNNRFVEFQDGIALADPIIVAERGARGLAELSGKILSHKIRVRPVVAVPGWEVGPAQSPAGDAVLVNEKNAMMLLRFSQPADHIFDEDVAKLQEQLHQMCRNPML
jgi:hypothetical protein